MSMQYYDRIVTIFSHIKVDTMVTHSDSGTGSPFLLCARSRRVKAQDRGAHQESLNFEVKSSIPAT